VTPDDFRAEPGDVEGPAEEADEDDEDELDDE
jgi:hypothetical protein